MLNFRLALLALCLGCADTAEPVLQPRIDTGAVEYVLSGNSPVSVDYTIFNAGDAALYVDCCGELLSTMYERLEGGRWVPAGGGACLADRSWWPITIPSGQSHAGTVQIYRPGVYQLVTYAAAVPDPNRAHYLRSNIFIVR